MSWRPNAVEHLQQQRAQQLLWRDRGTSFARIELAKATVQFAQHLTDKRPYPPQRMARWHPRFRRDVRKKPALINKCAAHASSTDSCDNKLNQQILATARSFSADC